MGKVADATLPRREAVAELLAMRRELLVVTGLGSPAYDAMAAGDHDANFYLWGAMGSAATVGFGLAMAQPKRPVLVLTGDGEMMMGIGALATIALERPSNLTIVVLDNGQFGETGMQVSHAGRGVAIESVAAAMGFPQADRVTDMTGVQTLRDRLEERSGLRLAVLAIRPGNEPRILPPRDGVHNKNRFREHLGFRTI